MKKVIAATLLFPLLTFAPPSSQVELHWSLIQLA
jgi:hypothetical protein